MQEKERLASASVAPVPRQGQPRRQGAESARSKKYENHEPAFAIFPICKASASGTSASSSAMTGPAHRIRSSA
jgi:hypothetical protein